MRTATLEDADQLREEQPHRALEIYAALRQDIDPGDAERILWIARARPHPESGFAALYRAAFEAGAGELRWEAANALGREAAWTGGEEEAERWWRIILAEARGSGHQTWRGACVNLAQLYLEQGRVIEGLVLAQRVVDEARRAEDDYIVTLGYLALGNALADIGDAERLADAHALLEEAAARLPAPLRRRLAGHVRRVGFLLQRLRGTPAAPLDELDDDEPAHEAAAKGLRLAQIGALQDQGDFEGAAALLAEALATREADPDLHVDLRLAQVRQAAHESPEDGIAAARRLLDAARGTGPWARHGRPFGHARRLRVGRAVGRLLLETCRAPEEAHAAFEMAAAATVARVAEINRCTAEMPELTERPGVDYVIVSEYRARLVRENDAILQLVADHLRAHPDFEPLRDLLVTGNHLAMCAWCKRVRTRDGRWLPILQFLPDSDDFDVTAGICPDCADKVRRGV